MIAGVGASATACPTAFDGAPERRRAGPLTGRTILVTRPQEQAGSLAAAIRSAGGRPWLLPTIAVLPIEGWGELDASLARLADYDLVVFVSANAVSHAAARALALGMPGLAAVRRAAAPGPATAAAARRSGVVRVIAPLSRFDSEGLVAALAGDNVRIARVLILRGAATRAGKVTGDGREMLARWLRAQGALVDSVACYRRRRALPSPDALAALERGTLPDGVVIASSEGARHLAGMLGPAAVARLADVPVFVPHPRIGAVLREIGMTQIRVTAGGDAGIMRGMTAHFGGGA